MQLGRRKIAAAVAVLAVAGVAGYLGFGVSDGDEPAVADALAHEAGRPIVERLGCDQVAAESQTRPDEVPAAGSIRKPFDCWVDGEFLARIYVAVNDGELRTREEFFSFQRYGEPLQGMENCPNALDPVIVTGDGWLALTGTGDAATKVAERAEGEVKESEHHGPVVSYVPLLPPCE